jgi:hypothetical protein
MHTALGISKQIYNVKCREINRGGLNQLYEVTLMASTVEFAQAMKVPATVPLCLGDMIASYVTLAHRTYTFCIIDV